MYNTNFMKCSSSSIYCQLLVSFEDRFCRIGRQPFSMAVSLSYYIQSPKISKTHNWSNIWHALTFALKSICLLRTSFSLKTCIICFKIFLQTTWIRKNASSKSISLWLKCFQYAFLKNKRKD